MTSLGWKMFQRNLCHTVWKSRHEKDLSPCLSGDSSMSLVSFWPLARVNKLKKTHDPLQVLARKKINK